MGLTHIGRRRRNEDSFAARDDLQLWAVADGLGGMAGGDIASALVVHRLVADHATRSDAPVPWLTDPELRLRAALSRAHEEVLAQHGDEQATMASTIAVLRLDGPRAIVAHVGDSRVYRLRDERLEQLTVDHSLATDPDPSRRHVVTRALGVVGAGHPDVRVDRHRPTDTYLVCSDGLTNALDHDAITAILVREPLERAAGRLLAAALEAGGSDNVTVIVVAPEAPTEARDVGP